MEVVFWKIISKVGDLVHKEIIVVKSLGSVSLLKVIWEVVFRAFKPIISSFQSFESFLSIDFSRQKSFNFKVF